MDKKHGPSFGYRVYRQLKKVFGPAQLGRMGEPRERVKNRLQGVEGQWVLRRNSEGRTYLAPVTDQKGAGSADGAPGVNRGQQPGAAS